METWQRILLGIFTFLAIVVTTFLHFYNKAVATQQGLGKLSGREEEQMEEQEDAPVRTLIDVNDISAMSCGEDQIYILRKNASDYFYMEFETQKKMDAAYDIIIAAQKKGGVAGSNFVELETISGIEV